MKVGKFKPVVTAKFIFSISRKSLLLIYLNYIQLGVPFFFP